MNDSQTEFIESIVGAINDQGDAFAVLCQDVDDSGELLTSLEGSPVDYIHVHEPWNRMFIVWYDDEPAYIASEFYDQWSVTPSPDGSLIDRANVYVELSGPRRMVPSLTYEPAGEETTAIELELHPIEDIDQYRAVAKNGEPIPDIRLQVHEVDND